MSWTKNEIIDGIKCETCMEERTFGNIPNDNPDNLYIYKDLGGNTRCFCKNHMSFTEKNEPYYGAIRKDKLLT